MSDSDTTDAPVGDMREQVEAIVAGGGDVRGRISGLVENAWQTAHQGGESLLSVARSVMEAATEAINKGVSSVPADGTLRQVIDGLGDGLSRSALSARAAVEEAGAHGKRFATEDLQKLKDELTALTTLYTQTVREAVSKARDEASAGIGGLMAHAEAARTRMGPALKSAIDATVHDPVGLGKDSLHAGLAASQFAAGTLFTTVGRLLQQAGQKLKPEGP